MQFDEYLERWALRPDGDAIITHSSRLLPVVYEGMPAMLKVAVENDEKLGNEVMVWWNGNGAAGVVRRPGLRFRQHILQPGFFHR
uniref:aminoglycoside phosphotransferase family protein n=1 Tax=Chitinophaga sp. TaxID=1869181 RepID=UPI002609F232